MTVHVRWYDDTHRILSYEYRGDIVWDDYLNALSQGRVMMQSVPHHVCVLNSMLPSTHLPDGFVAKVRTIIETEPDNCGCVVFVHPPLGFMQMMDKMQRVIPRFEEYCFYADTEDEALTLIYDWYSTQAALS